MLSYLKLLKYVILEFHLSMITLQGVPNKQILSNEVNLLELQSILVYQVLVNGMTMREVVLQGHLQGFYIIYT